MASRSYSWVVTVTARSDSSASSRLPSSSVDIPNMAGSGAGWAKYASVNSPGHMVRPMNVAMPAPTPLAW